MSRYLTLPNYANSLRRYGFTDEDIDGSSDRPRDAIVVCGSVEAVVERVAAQHDAGADHVGIQVLVDDAKQLPIDAWTTLAAALIP